ncbi:MAG: thioesterase family protein [Ilumatobacteraceae bacterium]
MTRYVAVVGGGPRAAQWATRYLAAGLDVVVDDRTVADAVRDCWPTAERLGLFPGATLERMTVRATSHLDAAHTVFHVVGDGVAPSGAAEVIDDSLVTGYEPIHVVPLVEIADDPRAERWVPFFESMGMAPRRTTDDARERSRLGSGLVELTGGDPDAIIAVMRSLRASGIGAGPVVAEHEARRYAARGITPWQPGDEVEAPLALYDARVEPDWVDYNGHMTEAAYLTAAGWASDALFRYIGDDEAYRAAGHSFFTIETHIHYLLEMNVHEPLHFTTQLLGADAKRMHLLHEMFHGDSGKMVCSVEQMLVHVDMNAGRSAPMLPDVAAAVDAIWQSHRSLPRSSFVGTVMQLPPPRT